MVTRDEIIAALDSALRPNPAVFAYWLEGADANGTVDEYSDIDLWLDIADDSENAVVEASEQALSALSAIDYKCVTKHGHPLLRQIVYHLQGTSEYLMIDFNIQLHSRQDNEDVLIAGDHVENAMVIFDKCGAVRFGLHDLSRYAEQNAAQLEEAKYLYTQHSRVLKYVHRGLFLEARVYYGKYVLDPLALLLRLIYTPRYTDYHFIHISHHIPENEVRRLEKFAKIASLEDIALRMSEAQLWFRELIARLDAMAD